MEVGVEWRKMVEKLHCFENDDVRKKVVAEVEVVVEEVYSYMQGRKKLAVAVVKQAKLESIIE